MKRVALALSSLVIALTLPAPAAGNDHEDAV